MEELKGRWEDKDVQFVVVYSKEPHPQERKFKKYTQHKTYEQKMSYARELVDITEMSVPVAVDALDEATVKAYGSMPNMVFVVNKEGTIVYKSSWAESNWIDAVLEELTASAHKPAESASAR